MLTHFKDPEASYIKYLHKRPFQIEAFNLNNIQKKTLNMLYPEKASG